MSYITDITIRDSGSLDAFGRLRTSSANSLFDSQLTYDLQPILWQQVTNGTGASIAHDSTNRMALMTFSSTPTGGQSYMQTYEHFRYSAGKSQVIFLTFNMIAATANCLKFAGYSDGSNGIEFQNDGTNNKLTIYSTTTAGNQSVNQSSWNLDTLDGNGPSGINLDITKTQILAIDLQALYVGRVRVGFDIDGILYYVHQFENANSLVYPYIATANLPLRIGMTCTGTVSTTMNLICSNVASEDSGASAEGYDFTAEIASKSLSNGVDTHAISIQPRTTFNSITNRAKIIFKDVDIIVLGNYPVHYELRLGQVLTSASFANANATYSTVDYDTAGTLSGSPAIVLQSGHVGASSQVKGVLSAPSTFKYPLTLDKDGAVRTMGRLTLILRSLGGSNTVSAAMNWREIR